MDLDSSTGKPDNDPQPAATQIWLPWDTEPQDKFKIQFHYTKLSDLAKNEYSQAPNDAPEGGGFEYEDCPKVFSGRTGNGPLRVAWDTNILIDYAKYGQLIWDDDDFNPPIEEGNYLEQLIALYELMNLWMIRDIRIRMPYRQIDDARRRLDEKTLDLRLWQIEQFRAALSCISLDVAIDANVQAFETLPEESSNDDWDKTLVEEAIATGCHVFLTRDRRLKKRNEPIARKSFVVILTPTELLDFLVEADELSLAKYGQYILPDTHKYSHVMDAHENGYPNR